MRIAIIIIFTLAVLVNIPDWLTVEVYVREDGAVRAKSTHLYNSEAMKSYYYLYHVCTYRPEYYYSAPYCNSITISGLSEIRSIARLGIFKI